MVLSLTEELFKSARLMTVLNKHKMAIKIGWL